MAKENGSAQKVAVKGAELAEKALSGWRLFWTVVSSTTIVYFIQLAFGILCMIGYFILGGLDVSSVVSSADIATFGSVTNVGAGLFWIGAGGAALCGFITFLIAASLFASNGFDVMVGLSVFILAVIVTLLLCPFLNLLPLMWLWCLYATFKGIRP